MTKYVQVQTWKWWLLTSIFVGMASTLLITLVILFSGKHIALTMDGYWERIIELIMMIGITGFGVYCFIEFGNYKLVEVEE